jgi:hypothetical protein
VSPAEDNDSGGLRAVRPAPRTGSAPLRAGGEDRPRPGIALRAEAGRGGGPALRPPQPRPAPVRSRLPIIVLVLIVAAGAGLWYFTRTPERLPALPPPTDAAAGGAAPASAPPQAAPDAAPALPRIAGNAGAYKERPQDPGGEDVPFQESLVYNDLKPAAGGEAAPPRVERLLPPPEDPLPKPAPAVPSTPVANVTPAIAGEGAPTADETGAVAVAERPQAPSIAPAAPPPPPPPAAATGVLGQLPVTPGSPEAEALKAENAAAEETPRPSPPASAAPASAASAARAPSAAAPPAESSAAPAAESSAAPPATAASEAPGSLEDVFRRLGTPGPGPAGAEVASAPGVSGAAPAAAVTFRIQLAAVRSEAEAASEWRRLIGRFPNELNGLSPFFERADLAQGTFYRVQAGPLSEADARARCAALNGQPGVSGCQPVRRPAAP